ncbi:hypothetical protein [Allorhizocola rhizosphaerae]|uniref:hypothetical protein n=1 Tax=Allorhizocola rhizosphaerae TaxID=1872709 RepID=UPI0013C2F0CD|nr:hypothetical protein [Allorhizocola rhizosphaerae]
MNFDVPAERPFRLLMTFGDRTFEFVENDLFAALISARTELERGLSALLPGCQAQRVSSGLMRQMNNGRFAYALTRDHPLSEEDIVDCFAESDASEVGTVEQQNSFEHYSCAQQSGG